MSKAIFITGGNGFVVRHVLAAMGMSSRSIRLVGRTFKIDQSVGVPMGTIYTSDLLAEDLFWWNNVCGDVDTVIPSPGTRSQECTSNHREILIV